MQNNLTQEQIENIQIDYGLVYLNYGETDQKKLGPTRGGAEFSATKNIRDIAYDGTLGKTKGMQVIDEINAVLKVSILDTSLATIASMMPQADYDSVNGIITNTTGGLIGNTKYFTNVTMFGKTTGGEYKKITLYNAMNESDFVLKAAAKSEGEVGLEIHAHWDPLDQSDLYSIEDVTSISDDTTKPTVTTTPLDVATGVSTTANLTALFSEDVRSSDITTDNFILIKASDGSIVAGSIVYNSSTKTATFDSTSNLTDASAYIWTIARVRDNAGNVMNPVVVNFTTA